MRSSRSGKASSTAMVLLTTTLLSLSALSTAFPGINHLWKKTPTPDTGFQSLGTTTAPPAGSNPALDPQDPATLAHTPTHNTTSLSDETPALTCATNATWLAPGLDKQQFITDCYLAVQRLYLEDVHLSPSANALSEFVAPPSADGFLHTTTKGELVQQTPLVYEANTCTLVIAMLSSFPAAGLAALPGNFRREGFRPMDTYSMRRFHMQGRKVENECLRRWGRAGWMGAGDAGDIGVFLWATNSSMNAPFRAAGEASKDPKHPEMTGPPVAAAHPPSGTPNPEGNPY